MRSKLDMNDWLSKLSTFARGAWRELPLETLAVATAALSLVTALHLDPDGALEVWLLRLIFGAILVTPLFFSVTLLRREAILARPMALAVGGVLALLVIGLMVTLLPNDDMFERQSFTWPYFLSVLAAILVPFVVVALSAHRDRRLDHFTSFVRRFFEQTSLWALMLLGSLAAISVVFYSLAELFDLEVEKLWADSMVLTVGAVVLTYLFRLLPEVDSARSRSRLPELWRRLVTTIGAPFVSVMLVILVVYEVFVLVSGEMPRNLLSPLIVAAGFTGFISTLIIVSILREDVGSSVLTPAEPHRWAKNRSIRLVRAFPAVLLILLPMAGWALALRIEQYGFTTFRVVRLMALACLAVLGLLGTIRWLRGRMALTWEVPACMIVFAMITAYGPISATQLSIRSQAQRLDQALTDAGVTGRTVPDTAPHAVRQVEYSVFWELDDLVSELADLGGEDALRRVLDGRVEQCAERWGGTNCLHLLGIRSEHDSHDTRRVTAEAGDHFANDHQAVASVDIISGSSGEQVWDLRLALPERAQEPSLEVWREDRVIAELSLAPLITEWNERATLPPKLFAVRDASGAVLGHLAVQLLIIARDDSLPDRVERLTGIWLRPAFP